LSHDDDVVSGKTREEDLINALAEEECKKKKALFHMRRQISLEMKQSNNFDSNQDASGQANGYTEHLADNPTASTSSVTAWSTSEASIPRQLSSVPTHIDENKERKFHEDQLRNFGPLRLRNSARNVHDPLLTPAMSEAAMLKEQDEEGHLLRRRKECLTEEQLKNIPRMVHRNMPFHQSRNDIAVFKASSSRSPRLKRILRHDWFHVLLRWPSYFSISSLLFAWTAIITVFALIYQLFDNPESECGLGPKGETIGFSTAFAFSLETCTTVGYGLPNSSNGFFEPECSRLQFIIYLQMVFSMMFNGFLFAFMFARLGRCESRAVQVLFSDKAIIEIQDGKWYLHVRVYDMDSAQPVIEAHVRMYCVSWRDYENQIRDDSQPHLLHHMRVLIPNDDLGSMMFTSIPANVTHHIDAYSPLAPVHLRKKVNSGLLGDVELREVDDMTGNRSDIPCPVCGETFGVVDHLQRHIKYMQVIEEADGSLPIAGTHRDQNLIKPKLTKSMALTEKDIREHLIDKEIMCVVEAIEPIVSGTFQALQSYKLKDMQFGGRFAPCMSQKDDKIYVDVNKFHEIIDPSDSSRHHYIGEKLSL